MQLTRWCFIVNIVIYNFPFIVPCHRHTLVKAQSLTVPCHTQEWRPSQRDNFWGISCLYVAPSSSKQKTYSSVRKQGEEVKQQNEIKKWLSKNNMVKIQASSSAMYMQVLRTSKAIWELLSTAKSSGHITEPARVWRQSWWTTYLFTLYVIIKNKLPQIKKASWQRPKRTLALKILQ